MATEAIIFQQIVDINWDQAIYTASPNNTINVVQFAAKGSGTNIGIALTPKGTGYISAQVPDGTAAGGNARGARAVDLQTSRTANFMVASGIRSAVLGGRNNTASGEDSACIGADNGASGSTSFAIGFSNSASAQFALCLGSYGQATAVNSTHLGRGGLAHRRGMLAYSTDIFSAIGDRQWFIQEVGGKTTSDAATELFIFGTTPINIRAGTVIHGILTITGVRSDGSAIARYLRHVAIKRVGSTTSLEGAVGTIGVDQASGTSISITADDTNDALRIEVTGVASQTWRWIATLCGQELAFGT